MEIKFDTVVEATGNELGLKRALNFVKPRGRIVLKSTFHGKPKIDLSKVVVDEIQLFGSRCGPFDKALEIENKVAEKIGAQDVFGDKNIAKISVIGVGMKNHSGVASIMFHTLAKENINIIMISTSEIRISCIIEEKYTELAVRVLHTAFGLDKE